MKIMAIDLGDARTGIAVSDITGFLTGEAYVISQWNMEKLCETIASDAKVRNVERIVVGYPKNMDGTLGARAELCAAFADNLKKCCGIEVVLWDERRTTVDAHRILSDVGKHGKKRKNTVDAVAASLILEGYLESINRRSL